MLGPRIENAVFSRGWIRNIREARDDGVRGLSVANVTSLRCSVLAADGLDAADPVDVMTWIDRNFHQPCDLGRAGLPEEIASITAYLVSRRNGYLTGATVNVDGGSDFV
jgi:3-oxoacyl-[acyl-carrier protein] reductase